MHIGLIGGIGPAATEFYYRGLVARHAASGTHLELTIDHADLRELAKKHRQRRRKAAGGHIRAAHPQAGRRRCEGRGHYIDWRPLLHS
jgi:aspartate/glutamate racemase